MVVGAGIAGLSAALELQGRVSEVLVIDASDRPGGVLRTDHVSGYVIERGANTIQVKAPMLGFLRRLSLEETLLRARPASRVRFVYRDGGLLRIPMSPLGFARTPLLSAGGKLRLLAEPLMRRGDASRETVAEFAGRRLGAQAVSRLIGPFLTGVYAGDEERLGAAAVLGSFTELERRFGSIALGLVASARARRRARGLRGSYSAQEGLGPFARRLAALLVEPPALGARVRWLRRDAGTWLLGVADAAGDRSLRTSRVVLATPAAEVASLLRSAAPDVAEALDGIEYAPIVGVPLGVDPRGVRTPIEGFGFLVPRDSGLRLLGCLFMSQLFPGRAPQGRELLQCLLGGRRWPEAVDVPDDLLSKQLRGDLERALGLEVDPHVLAVTRWRRAIPQPGRDHVARIAAAREGVARLGGIALAGSYLDGVSVADTVASGLRAAREIEAR